MGKGKGIESKILDTLAFSDRFPADLGPSTKVDSNQQGPQRQSEIDDDNNAEWGNSDRNLLVYIMIDGPYIRHDFVVAAPIRFKIISILIKKKKDLLLFFALPRSACRPC
jgi:hypothetical protein